MCDILLSQFLETIGVYMKTEDKSVILARELSAVIEEARSIGAFLDGDLMKNKRAKYVKKDGTCSYYSTSPILRYRSGHGVLKHKRIPSDKVAEIEMLLEDGKRFKALMGRYQALAAELALIKKKN